MSSYSKCDWLLHDSFILTNVCKFKSHNVRRVFHIPILIVHPICGWASVVSPSCVMTENPSIFSSQSNDLRCICTHPRSLSSRGQGPLRDSSDSLILVLESVTRDGWLVISGFGSGSQKGLLSLIYRSISHRVFCVIYLHQNKKRRKSGENMSHYNRVPPSFFILFSPFHSTEVVVVVESPYSQYS